MTGVSQLAPGTSLSTNRPRDLVTNWGEVGEGCLAYAKSWGLSELQLLYPLRTASSSPLGPGYSPLLLRAPSQPSLHKPGMAEGGLARPSQTQPLIPQITSGTRQIAQSPTDNQNGEGPGIKARLQPTHLRHM